MSRFEAMWGLDWMITGVPCGFRNTSTRDRTAVKQDAAPALQTDLHVIATQPPNLPVAVTRGNPTVITPPMYPAYSGIQSVGIGKTMLL